MAWAAIAAAMLGVGCASTLSPPAEEMAHFLKRRADWRWLAHSSPFQPQVVDLASRQIFYLIDEGEKKTLWRIGEEKRNEWRRGEKISEEDFSRRLLMNPRYSAAWGGLVARSGEEGEDALNLWLFPEHGGRPKRLTAADQVLSFVQPEGEGAIVYLARYGRGKADSTCLEWLPEEKGKPQRLWCDREGGDRFAPTGLSLSPSGRQVAFVMMRGGRRDHLQLCYLDLASRRLRRVPQPAQRHLFLPPRWSGEQVLLWIAAADTPAALYRYRLGQRAARRIGPVAGAFYGLAVLRQGKREVLAALQRDGLDTLFWLLDPLDGRGIFRRRFDGVLSIRSVSGETLILQQETASFPFRYWSLRLQEVGIPVALSLYLEVEAEAEPLPCRVSRAPLPAAAWEAKSSRRRPPQALLFEPQQPLSDSRQRLYLIEVAPGGENRFRPEVQLDCALGITTLSLARGDHVGNTRRGESVDIIVDDLAAAARYLEGQGGAKASQIGLVGAGVGAWAALRALTLPEEGRRYPFAFAIADSGIYDFPAVFAHRHLPDWVEREFGSPDKDRQRLIDLSPIRYAAELRAPVLLLSRTSDRPWLLEQSELMQQAIQQAGKESQRVLLAESNGEREKNARRQKYLFLENVLAKPGSTH